MKLFTFDRDDLKLLSFWRQGQAKERTLWHRIDAVSSEELGARLQCHRSRNSLPRRTYSTCSDAVCALNCGNSRRIERMWGRLHNLDNWQWRKSLLSIPKRLISLYVLSYLYVGSPMRNTLPHNAGGLSFLDSSSHTLLGSPVGAAQRNCSRGRIISLTTCVSSYNDSMQLCPG